jgi:membrane protein DedA with SNARE-associated domain
MGLFTSLFQTIQTVIESLGLAGIAILMALESMIAPVPSEAVLPFGGFLVVTGHFTFLSVMAASSLGSMVGSWISYAMGFYGGRPLILAIGKYFLLNEKHLVWTETFFARFGGKTIFVARFIPVVRHLISIPAGLGKMNVVAFSIYTFVGATLWNGFLVYCGIKLKENWEIVHHYSRYLDYLVLIGLLGFAVYMLRAHLLPRK